MLSNRKYLNKKHKKLKSNFLESLTAINHAAQILLCLVAIIGYFYTVRPLYSKALLEEQIAEKEINIKKLSSELAKINTSIKDSRLALRRIKIEAEKTYTFAKSEALINIGENLSSCSAFRSAEFSEGNLADLLSAMTNKCTTEITSNKYIYFALNAEDRKDVLISIENINESFKSEAKPIVDSYIKFTADLYKKISKEKQDDGSELARLKKLKAYNEKLLTEQLRQVYARQTRINFWDKYEYIWR